MSTDDIKVPPTDDSMCDIAKQIADECFPTGSWHKIDMTPFPIETTTDASRIPHEYLKESSGCLSQILIVLIPYILSCLI